MSLLACVEETAAPVAVTATAGLDEGCGPALACASWLVCIDGQCVERSLPPDAVAEAADVWVTLDLGALSDPDALTDLVLDSEIGPDGADTLDVWDVSPGDVGDTMTHDISKDSSTDAPSDADTEDAGPASDADAGPAKQLLFLKDDSVEAGAGEIFFIIKDAEAWVTELTTPVDGKLMYVEVFLADVMAATSCGRYRVALWVDDENGQLPDNPTHVDTHEHLLGGDPDGQMLTVEMDAQIPPGEFRIGLLHEGPCTPDDQSPSLMSDVSGETADTWLWIPVDDTLPWVPASFFGVEGRWAIRAILEIEPPPEP